MGIAGEPAQAHLASSAELGKGHSNLFLPLVKLTIPSSTTSVGIAPLPCSMDTTLSWEQFLHGQGERAHMSFTSSIHTPHHLTTTLRSHNAESDSQGNV